MARNGFPFLFQLGQALGYGPPGRHEWTAGEEAPIRFGATTRRKICRLLLWNLAHLWLNDRCRPSVRTAWPRCAGRATEDGGRHRIM